MGKQNGVIFPASVQISW